MKISRTLLSYAGVIGALSLSQVALGQTAPAAPAPAAPVPAATPASQAPVASEPGAASTSAGVAIGADTTTLGGGSSAAQPAPAELMPAPLPAVEPAPSEPPADKAETFPKKLAVGKEGWLQIGGLAQAWFGFETAKNIAKDTDMGKDVDNRSYFRIRRAQLKLSGAIIPGTVEFLMLADFAKSLKGSKMADAQGNSIGYYASGQDSSPLLDFLFTVKSDYVDVSMGQWKSPISYEANTSSADLILPERAYSTRYFGDNYDMGIKLEKKFEYVRYSAQVLQGGTANALDSNKQKDLALRLEFYPIDGLFVGGAGLASVGQRDTQASTREIIEVDAGYDRDGILLRGEMLWGKRGATNAAERPTSRGMSLSGAYTIAKKYQPSFRLGFLDVDQTVVADKPLPLEEKFGVKTDEVRSYEVGFNYLIAGKNAKIMASYGYYYFDKFPARSQVLVAGQAAF